MKKAKFLVGTLVLSAAMLGTGYALWSDTIEVTSNVTTGNLEVGFDTDATVVTKGIVDKDSWMQMVGSNSYNVEDAKLTATSLSGKVTKDVATIDLKQLCPGYVGSVTMDVENVGSMAAMLSGLNVDVSGVPEQLRDDLFMGVTVYDKDGKATPLGTPIDGKYYTLLTQAQPNFIKYFATEKQNTIYLQNDTGMKVEIFVGMIRNAENTIQSELGSPEVAGTIKINLDWTQYNK